MSSIRVQVIVPVVILAVRKCAVDPSPYVRKAAAHAIPKVFRLDPKRVDELTEIIETMLRDSTPFVLSSAVAAFQEVCPERIDLIHRHYRKICRMLVDCDEWGQILLANLLLRYARTQFTRPDAYDRSLAAGADDDDEADKTLELVLPGDGGAFEKASSNPLAGTKGFYSSSDSDDSDDDDDDDDDADAGESGGSDSDVPRAKKPPAVVKKKSDRSKKKRSKKGSSASKKGPRGPKPTKDAAAAAADRMTSEWLDDDHRLLLRSSRPLLQSQNTGVVMAAASLQFYLAPVADLPKVLRALVFAMRMKPEAQHVMLKNICTMCAVQSSLFQAHFASFFVHPADPVDVRALKLEILTHVVTSDNAAALLRELQSYLRSTNNEFVALTIRAIGRCAAIMPQIAAVCIRSLLELSLHPSEEVAGEAVVVIRALVQQNPKEHAVIVMRLVRRLEMLAAPAARSAVAWLAGGELYIFGEKASVSLAALPEPVTADPTPEGPSGFVATQVSMLESSLLDSPTGTNGSDAGEERGDAAIDALIAAAAGGEGEDSPATEDAGAGAVAVVDEKAQKRAAKKAEKEEKKRLDAANAAKAEAEQREKFFELSFSVLKRSLRNFARETDVTKLQILNSACKLFIKDPNRVGPVLKHVFALCATDPSADMRDRVRIYRAMYAVGGNAAPLAALKEKIVLCDKPAPKLPSPAAPTCVHALGSLSHFVEHVAPGFVALPDHPDVQPPSHVRDQYYNQNADAAGKAGKKSGKGGFYSDSDDSTSDSDSDSDSDSGSGSSGSGSSSSSDARIRTAEAGRTRA